MNKKQRLWLIGLLSLVIIIGIIWFWREQAAAPVRPYPHTTKTNPTLVPVFDKSKYSTTNPSSAWVVVNKQRPLKPINFSPTDLVSVGNGQFMRADAAKELTTMFTDSALRGLPMQAASAYRSYQTQVIVYAKEVKYYGQAVANSESARPGYSEHQTGLAVDVSGGGCVIENCFGNTSQGKWLVDNAYHYGFIIRYPSDKVAITGYRYEPWHIRFVGIELATEMHNQNIKTLEEFFGLPAAPNY